MRARWIAACATGEAPGMAAVALVYAAIDRGVLGPALPWILLAGVAEGLSLGAMQALVLRRAGIGALRWVLLTIAAAVAGYVLSALGGAGSGETSAPAPWLVAVLGAGLGVVMGALMGACQWLALRGRTSCVAWMAGNAAGWAPGMAIIMLAAGLVGPGASLAGVAMAGAAAGAVAGALVGVATGVVLGRSGIRT